MAKTKKPRQHAGLRVDYSTKADPVANVLLKAGQHLMPRINDTSVVSGPNSKNHNADFRN